MKLTMAVLAVLVMVAGLAGSVQAKDITSVNWIAARDNFNDNYYNAGPPIVDTRDNNWGVRSNGRCAKARQEMNYYCDFSATGKAELLAILGPTLTNIPAAGQQYLVKFMIAKNESQVTAGETGMGADYFTPHVAVFTSLTDWGEMTATHNQADTDLGTFEPIPWKRVSDNANVTFWGLAELTNSLPVVGGWATPTFYGTTGIPQYISWSSALMDRAVLNILLTDPNARGLRMWDEEYYNDGMFCRDQWGTGPTIVTPRLVVIQALEGDAQLDDDVDFADYQKLEAKFGTTTGASWADGDFQGANGMPDGDVDFADYQKLEANFGVVLVPEPATIGLLTLCIGGLVSMRKRKGLMSVLFALVVLGGMAAGSQAAVVTLSVTSPSAGNWAAYLSASSDCAGLSSFIINVTADSGLAITSSLCKAPKAMDFEMNLVGFTLSRSNGLLGIGVGGGQVTAYSSPGGANDPLLDALVLQGVGITAGSYTGLVSTTWTAPVLLASGAYSGTAGWLHVRVGDGQFNVLNKVNNGPWVGPGNVSQAGWSGADLLIPEPATMLLVVGGAAAMVIRRRR